MDIGDATSTIYVHPIVFLLVGLLGRFSHILSAFHVCNGLLI
jgi:hypothetical protein